MDGKKNNHIILSDTTYPNELPILPVNDRPVFPGMVVPLVFDEGITAEFIEYILTKKKGMVGVVLLNKKFQEAELSGQPIEKKVELDDLRSVGCVGKILKAMPTPTNEMQLLINVQKRFTINSILENDPNIIAKVTYIEGLNNIKSAETQTYISALISKIKELIKLNSIFSEEMKLFIARYGADNPDKLTDMVASMLTTISAEEMQEILENFDLHERITKVLHFVHKEVEVSRLKEKINQQIEEKISKQQRDFFLNEQLKNIQKELGMTKDEKSSDIEKLTEKAAKLALTEEAKKVFNEEVEKLKIYDVRSSEYGVVRNYLNWIVSLPWGVFTEDLLEIENVSKILDKDHYGLEEVKDRIIEFVAVQRLKKDMKGSILCFAGPPGVGKTSLGKSIAHALGRKFYNFSLGGMRDDAEIKGHRRTYIGAMPGKIIQALKTVESANPVIMMDEIDKIHTSYQGDPASALLEVLDPEQNTMFQDHYLDLRFDLSQVLFICTANSLDTIPEPLLDRMEIIRISGYILEEKRHIAKRFVIPKQMKMHGITSSNISFLQKGIDHLIKHYAKEAGVRSLEQQIKKILRKVAVEMAKGKTDKAEIDVPAVTKYLGTERFKEESPYDKIAPGIVTGLAWTQLGGSTLYIESIVVRTEKGKGGLKLTGKLGDVMQESANLAYSYVTSIAPKYKIEPHWFEDTSIHLHVPAGATPKDGPSAGITIALSFFSLAINKKVSEEYAMTGELTISGNVLPIGGVREKLIAAKTVGKKRVIFPLDNKKDVDELPEYLRKGISIHFVDKFTQLLELIFKL